MGIILEVGKKYNLVFIVGGNVLKFTAEILEDSEDIVVFKDKFGKEGKWNKEFLVSATDR